MLLNCCLILFLVDMFRIKKSCIALREIVSQVNNYRDNRDLH